LCAADQGKFWELHDWMFQHQQDLSADSLKAKVGDLGLDATVFAACLDGKKHAGEVDQDLAEAQRLGITGTPGFVINGRLISGAQPLTAFTEVINDELNRAGVALPTEPKQADAAPTPAPAS
jgi:protein-disulfide isomerase